MDPNRFVFSLFENLNSVSVHYADPSTVEMIRKNKDKILRQAKQMDEPWNEMIEGHVNTLLSLDKDMDYVTAYKHQHKAASAVVRQFDKGSLPLLFNLLKDLKWIAVRADNSLVQKKEKAIHLEDCARLIMRAYNFALNDRSPIEVSRKWGVYYLLALLFRSYVKLNTLNLGKNSLRALANVELPNLKHFPKSHRVMYRAYVGYYHFYNEDYEQAYSFLKQAFEECASTSIRNKRWLLRYLLPCSLLYGTLPADQLLHRYSLQEEYGDIVESIRNGNVALFEKTMEDKEYDLLAAGTYLVVEKLRILVWRGLIKKVWSVTGKTNRLSVEHVRLGFNLGCSGNEEKDDDEIECIVANLISKGLTKGYISHEKRMIVLSKDNPFPKIQDIIAINGVQSYLS